jgi:CBS domain-containing protein
VPVLGPDGALLGAVSEVDLLCKQEHEDDEPGARCPHLAGHGTREDWRKAEGRTAAELMTASPPTTTSGATLPSAARLLARDGVRRLWVLDRGKVVGVVARRDVLRTFLRTDRDLRSEVDRDAFAGADRNNVLASVRHGVVLLTGRLEYEDDVAAAGRVAHAVPGVVAVQNRLDYVWTGRGAHSN